MLRINSLGGLFVQGDGGPLSGAAAQPRRLAILALLAKVGERGITRDKLLALLWPDADEERARKILTQALYALRKDLGEEGVFLGVKDLRLNPDVVTSDVQEFEAAISGGQLEQAARLYHGPFLEGFNLPGAPEFERWQEVERGALARKYAEALDRLAAQAAQRQDHGAAVGWWKALAAQDPINARVALSLMKALVASGDPHGALQHARVHEALLEQELDAPPDREVVAFAQQLRREIGEPRPARGTAATGSASAPPAAEPAREVVPAETQATPPLPMATTAMAGSPPPNRSEYSSGFVPDTDPPGIGVTSGWATASHLPDSFALPAPPLPVRRSHRAALLVAGSVIILAALVAGAWRWWPRKTAATAESRVVAVGWISDYTGDKEGVALARPLADMLATNLARAQGLQVVSTARMYELRRQLGAAEDTASGIIYSAARQAGATELVDGALYAVAAGHYRLDLRRIDLSSGSVLKAYTVQAGDLFTLADSGTLRLVENLGIAAPLGSLSSTTTHSLVAYNLYEQGLRSYTLGDFPSAERLFGQALTEDSTFAMAAYYYALTAPGTGQNFARFDRAVRLADRASDRERLIIRAGWAGINNSPALRALAETLVVRYPAELEGHLLLGKSLVVGGAFLEARPHLLEVVQRDSLGLRGAVGRCLACDALQQLNALYAHVDSFAAARRISRLWTRLQPGSARAWLVEGGTLEMMDSLPSAAAAYARADSIDPESSNGWEITSGIRVRSGDFEAADKTLRERVESGSPDQRLAALWLLGISLRYQDRFPEALEVARRYRTGSTIPAGPRGSTQAPALLEAQVLYEAGRFAASAALFDSIARWQLPGQQSSAIARSRAWSLSHVAGSLAAAGDTGRLPRLADSVRILGAQSDYGRDQRLHSYVEGLLLEARHQPAEAEAAYRAAIYSPTSGYTRVNVALAKLLLAQHRPREAVAILEPALRGGLDSSNLYVTRTELHRLLGAAWRMAGNADSAVVQEQMVARAIGH